MAHVAAASRKPKVSNARRERRDAPVFDSPLARLIRMLRDASGARTRGEWAKAIGVEWLTAYRWERNGSIPDRDSVDGIVKAIGSRVPNVRVRLERAIGEQREATGEPPRRAPQSPSVADGETTTGPMLYQHPRWPAIERYLLVERNISPQTVKQTASLPWVWGDYEAVNEHKVFDIIRAAKTTEVP